MRRGQPPNSPPNQARKSTPPSLPSMATPRRPQPPTKGSGFLASVFVIAIIGGLGWLVMLIFGLGPYHSDDVTFTPLPTNIAILPPGGGITLIPTITQTVTITATAKPTQTPTITVSPTVELLPFILIGEPETMSSDLLRPSLGCGWLIIAGQVWDLQDAPLKGLTLRLFGELGGFTIDRSSLTGSSSDFGVSGYEFLLQDLVLNSREALFIQLFDVNEMPLSHPYAIETFQDCQRNLILVNFKQVR